MRRTLAVAAVVALGLAACSSGEEPQAAPSSPSPSPRPTLVTQVAEPVLRVADPSAVIGVPPADLDPTLAETAAAAVAEAVEAAAIAAIEGRGTATLPGDPALTGPAVGLLDVLDRPADPVMDVSVTTVADASPGGILVTVTLDALTADDETIVIEFSFTVSPDGEPFLAVAEVTEAPPAPAPAPSPTAGQGGAGATGEPTGAETEEAS
ncbi:MAG: hypothetical protein KY469_16905 [Actinobacteria bacterium]|nr:hypothetical protein [Actinomycetota bacterium]